MPDHRSINPARESHILRKARAYNRSRHPDRRSHADYGLHHHDRFYPHAVGLQEVKRTVETLGLAGESMEDILKLITSE